VWMLLIFNISLIGRVDTRGLNGPLGITTANKWTKDFQQSPFKSMQNYGKRITVLANLNINNAPMIHWFIDMCVVSLNVPFSLCLLST